MTMNRKTFIKDFWNPYPSLAELPLANAIISRWTSDLQVNFGEVSLYKMKEGPKFMCNDVLLPGDWVAVSAENGASAQVALLSPMLSEDFAKSKKFQQQQSIYPHFRKWLNFLQTVRGHFLKQNFLECVTPSLVKCPGTEVFLEPFRTELIVGRNHIKLNLPTSPELHLKKILIFGEPKVFEMAKVYRNGEITDRHQPEFTMLEWYRTGAPLADIECDALDLVFSLVKAQGLSAPKLRRASVAELFMTFLNFELTPQTTHQSLLELAVTLNLASSERLLSFNWDELFHLIFIEKIEGRWSEDEIVVVHSYPPSQAAYSRISEQGWGERFEIYWRGLELCNAFHELNNPQLQRERFLEDLDKKTAAGLAAVDLDEEFLDLMTAGMPPSSGIAFGLERLFMAVYGYNKISDFKPFTLSVN
jgi:elongation factor P--(R)-beta-lysine ligase